MMLLANKNFAYNHESIFHSIHPTTTNSSCRNTRSSTFAFKRKYQEPKDSDLQRIFPFFQINQNFHKLLFKDVTKTKVEEGLDLN